MKSQGIKLFSIIVFFFLGINTSLHSQSKIRETCNWCSGKGKISSTITCPNCKYWTKFQKEVNPCNVCKNKRYINSGRFDNCTICEGKGYKLLLNLSPNLAQIQLHTRGLFSEDEKNRAFWNQCKLESFEKTMLNIIINLQGDKVLILTFLENGKANMSLTEGGKEVANFWGTYNFQNNDSRLEIMSHHFTATFKAGDKNLIFNSRSAFEGPKWE